MGIVQIALEKARHASKERVRAEANEKAAWDALRARLRAGGTTGDYLWDFLFVGYGPRSSQAEVDEHYKRYLAVNERLKGQAGQLVLYFRYEKRLESCHFTHSSYRTDNCWYLAVLSGEQLICRLQPDMKMGCYLPVKCYCNQLHQPIITKGRLREIPIRGWFDESSLVIGDEAVIARLKQDGLWDITRGPGFRAFLDELGHFDLTPEPEEETA